MCCFQKNMYFMFNKFVAKINNLHNMILKEKFITKISKSLA